MVKYSVRVGAIDGLYFYPKTVQERAFEIGLTTKETMQKKRKAFMTEFYIVMLTALVLIIGLWNRVIGALGVGFMMFSILLIIAGAFYDDSFCFISW